MKIIMVMGKLMDKMMENMMENMMEKMMENMILKIIGKMMKKMEKNMKLLMIQRNKILEKRALKTTSSKDALFFVSTRD